MSEITTGIRRILSNPKIYDFLQNLLGGGAARKQITVTYIRPDEGMKILDIGCGPADILDSLPNGIEYTGFDASPKYIERARQRYGDKGRFFQEYINKATVKKVGEMDLVLATGVLHHLEDAEVCHLSGLAFDALRSGGRLLTIDPCYEQGQSPLARYLIGRDRGQNVRSAEEYRLLLNREQEWQSSNLVVRHDLLRVPYTHAIIECWK